MYKGTAASLRRATGVHQLAPQRATTAELELPSLATMDEAQLLDEQACLRAEIAHCENEIRAAKARGHTHAIKGTGYRKATLSLRAGEVADRLKALRRLDLDQLWLRAIDELAPEHAAAIYARKRQLQQEAK